MRVDRFVFDAFGFPSRLAAYVWMALAGIAVPATAVLRFWDWGNPLLEPHPIRQTQTALAALWFSKGQASLLDYASPYRGALWNFVQEFPLYQFLVGLVMRTGLGLEVAARSVTLLSFLVSTFFFWKLAEKLFDRHVAMWAVLLFWISPFNVLYSRVCLIDPLAVCLMLGASWAALESRLATATILGSLAAVVKVTVWYAPTTALFLWAAKKRRRWILLSLIGQLVVAVVWIRWAVHVRGEASTGLGKATWEWIVGPWGERFSPECWWRILRPILRLMLHDWMAPAFLVALGAPGPYRKRALGLLAIAVFTIVGPFHVSQYHDYYAIAVAPFLLAIAGVGLARLWVEKTRWAHAVLAVSGLLLLGRAARLPFVYGNLFVDDRPKLAEIHRIKALTRPNEVVYVAAGPESYEYALYADRLIMTHRRAPNPVPTSWFFPDGKFDAAAFEGIAFVWAEGEAYRTDGVFDPDRHLAVSSYLPQEYRATAISKCDGPGWLELTEKGSTVVVNGRPMPWRRYVHYPAPPHAQCPIEVKIIP